MSQINYDEATSNLSSYIPDKITPDWLKNPAIDSWGLWLSISIIIAVFVFSHRSNILFLIQKLSKKDNRKIIMNFKQFFVSLFCNCSCEWKPDNESYDLMINDENKANFLYKTSQEKLQSTIDGYSSLEKKIIIFLSYLIFVNTVMAGFIIKNFSFGSSALNQNIPFYWQLIVIFALFSITAMVLITILKPKKFFYKGNNPENLFDKDYCSLTYSQMIVGESILYKERIDHNQSLVERGTYLFNRLFIITIILPIILFAFH